MTRLALLHQDDDLVAIDKPSGLIVHRGWADDADSVLSLLRAQLGRLVYPVHRLDRGTSGVLVLALSPDSARALGASFEAGVVDKRYLALVRGVPREAAGRIDHAIPRSEDGPRVPAATRWRTLAASAPMQLPDSPRTVRFSVLEAWPETGRLHQVRRHLKHLGHPVIGDANHGRGDLNRLLAARVGLRRLALHAATLSLPHPAGGAMLTLTATLPPDLALPFSALGLRLPPDGPPAPGDGETAT